MQNSPQYKHMQSTIHWECQPFAGLSLNALYRILQLRSEVFVVEQDCAYLDPDGLDMQAFHWMAWEGDRLIASQRCLPPGTPYLESSIGRIVTAPAERGRNLGRELVARGIDFNRSRWPGQAIRIGAQSRLRHFYEEFGFTVDGEPYMEDGIEHIHMQL